MDKKRAIQIMTKAAELYKDNLEDQKVLFLYGVPSEIKKQLQQEEKILCGIKAYEVVFHRYNFMHLTGVKINAKEIKSAIHFMKNVWIRDCLRMIFLLQKMVRPDRNWIFWKA